MTEYIIQNLNNLLDDIKAEIINLERVVAEFKQDGFGGAGVFITSEKNVQGYDNDLIVITRHAGAVGWLLYRIGDIAAPIIDYISKYEFYGLIAKDAQTFVAKNGDKKNGLKDLLVFLVENVIQRVDSDQEREEDYQLPDE
jgi:hypothetical protein